LPLLKAFLSTAHHLDNFSACHFRLATTLTGGLVTAVTFDYTDTSDTEKSATKTPTDVDQPQASSSAADATTTAAAVPSSAVSAAVFGWACAALSLAMLL